MSNDFDVCFKEFSSFLNKFNNLNQIQEGSSILQKMEAAIALTEDQTTKKKYKKSFFSCKSHFVNAIEDIKFAQEQNKLDLTENESSLNHFVNTENSTLSALNSLNARRSGKSKNKDKDKEGTYAPVAIEIVRSRNDYSFMGNKRRRQIIKYGTIALLTLFLIAIIIILIVVIIKKKKEDNFR